MLGEIKERSVPSEVKPLVAKHPTGFPKPGSRGVASRPLAAPNLGKLKRVHELAKKPSEVIPNWSSSSTLEVSSSSSRSGASQAVGEVQEEDFQRGNRERVQSMSKGEIDEAMQEIGSMISSKNLALMKKRLEAKQAQAAAAQKKSVNFEGITAPSTKEESKKEEEGPSIYDITKMPAHIASSLDELHSVKQRAPAYVKARIAWTGDANDMAYGDKDINEGSKHSATKQTMTDDVKHALARTMRDERFDLQGRKIVHIDSVTDELHAALKTLGLSPNGQKELALFIVDGVSGSSKGLSVRLARDVSTVIIDEEKAVNGNGKGAGWGDLTSTSSPQHPLLQHEKDPHSPGFTLEESIDLLRSQEPHQQGMALTLIEGVLRWRDAVTSLEIIKFPILSLQSEDVMSHDDITAVSTTDIHDSPLKLFFRSLLRETLHVLRKEGYNPGCDDTDSEDLADIRRILVHSLLLFVTSDLPPSLPFVLRWLCVPHGQRQLSWQNKHRAFRALDTYLFSAEEEIVANTLWSGYNGVYGAPFHPQPHTRRSDTESYEDFCLACHQEKAQLVAEEEEALTQAYAPKQEGQVHEAERYGQSQQPRPPLEAFSLSCRWDRVNSIMQGSFVGNSTGGGGEKDDNGRLRDSDVLRCMADYLRASAAVADGSVADSAITLSLAKGSVDILRSLGSTARAGDAPTLSLLMTVVVLPLWALVLEPLLSPISSSRSSSPDLVKLRRECQGQLLRLLSELARRDREIARWLLSEGQTVQRTGIHEGRPSIAVGGGIVSTTLTLLSSILAEHRQSGDTLSNVEMEGVGSWCFRLWRVLLAYDCRDMGSTRYSSPVGAFLVLSMAFPPPVSLDVRPSTIFSEADASPIDVTMGLGSSKLNMEYLWLLEALSVHISHVLHSSLANFIAGTMTSPEDAPLSSSSDTACLQVALLLVRWATVLLPSLIAVADSGVLSGSGSSSCDTQTLFAPCTHFIVSVLGTSTTSSFADSAGVGTSPISVVDKACNLRAYQEGLGILAVVKKYFECVGYTSIPTSAPAVVVSPSILLLDESLVTLLGRMRSILTESPTFMLTLVTMLHGTPISKASPQECGNIDGTPRGIWRGREARLAMSRWLLCVVALSSHSGNDSFTHSHLLSLCPSVESVLHKLIAESARSHAGTGRARACSAGGLLSWTYYRNIQPAMLLSLLHVLVKLDYMRVRQAEVVNSDAAANTASATPSVSVMRGIEAVTGCLDARYAFALTQLLKVVVRNKCANIEKQPAALDLMVNNVITTLLSEERAQGRGSGAAAQTRQKEQERQHLLVSLDRELRWHRLLAEGKPLPLVQQEEQRGAEDSTTVSTMSPSGWSLALAAPLSSSPVLQESTLSPSWQVKILGTLHSKAFHVWMGALQASDNDFTSPSPAGEPSSNAEGVTDTLGFVPSFSIEEVCTRLFYLMRLTTGAFHFNWLKHSPLYAPVGESDDENAIPPECVTAFMALLAQTCKSLLWNVNRAKACGTCVGEEGVAEIFEAVVTREGGVHSQEQVNHTTHSRLSYRDTSSGDSGAKIALNLSKKTGSGISLGGGLGELVERALDEAVNQVLHPTIHSAILTLLVSPYLTPPSLQARVWKALSEVRLLHLLEPEILLSSVTVTEMTSPLEAQLDAEAEASVHAHDEWSTGILTLFDPSHLHVVSPRVARHILHGLSNIRGSHLVEKGRVYYRLSLRLLCLSLCGPLLQERLLQQPDVERQDNLTVVNLTGTRASLWRELCPPSTAEEEPLHHRLLGDIFEHLLALGDKITPGSETNQKGHLSSFSDEEGREGIVALGRLIDALELRLQTSGVTVQLEAGGAPATPLVSYLRHCLEAKL